MSKDSNIWFPSRQIYRPSAGVLTSDGYRIAPPMLTSAERRRRAEQVRLAKLLHHMKCEEADRNRNPKHFDLQMFAGFSSYDDLINAITVLGQADDYTFSKQSIAPGLASYWHSTWYEPGTPGAGVAPAGSTTGTAYDGTGSNNVGGIGFTAVSTKQRYLVSFGAMSVIANTLLLVDRLMGSALASSLASTGSKTAGNATALPRYTTGIPVQTGLETILAATSTTTAVAAHLLSYTNQNGGGSGHVGGQVAYATGLPKIGDVLPTFLPLASGDTGITACATVNCDVAATASMTAALVYYRVLAVIPLPANTWVERDLVLQIAGLPRVYDAACLSFLYAASSATASVITGLVRTAYQ